MFKEIDRAIDEGKIEPLLEKVKHELLRLVLYIYKKGGTKATEIEDELGVPKRTIERYLKILRKADIIIYRGSAKTGGNYWGKSSLGIVCGVSASKQVIDLTTQN